MKIHDENGKRDSFKFIHLFELLVKMYVFFLLQAGEPWYPIDLVKLRIALLLILWSDLELVKLKLVPHAVLKGIL